MDRAEFTVNSDSSIALGLDGEAITLAPPLRFRIAPHALRILLPPNVAGLSPAALAPELSREGISILWTIAMGHTPGRSTVPPTDGALGQQKT